MARGVALEPRDERIVVTAQHVTKTFLLRHTRSIKEAFVWLIKGRKKDITNEFQAMDDVSFDIADGESVALMGFNGSGKSTTLKLISGVMHPDGGAVGIKGKVAGLIEVGAGFHPDLTGHDNVYLNGAILGMTKEQINAAYDDILAFADIGDFIDTEVKFYSSGMYLRLAFSVAVHTDPDVFLVDEILAVGDEPFQRKCIDKIRDFQEEGRSIILVSHSAEQIVDVCDRAVVLDRGAIIATGKAPDAMSMLHQWYQQQLLDASEAAKAAPGGAPPPRPCTIDGVELLDGLTDHPDGFKIFEPGSSLTVGIDLQAPDRLDEYAVLLNVETDRGQHVLGVDSRKLDLELPSFRGSARILVTLPRLYLGEGDFSFNAVVLNEDGFEIDNLRHAAFMAVRSDGTTVGFVKAFPEVRLEAGGRRPRSTGGEPSGRAPSHAADAGR